MIRIGHKTATNVPAAERATAEGVGGEKTASSKGLALYEKNFNIVINIPPSGGHFGRMGDMDAQKLINVGKIGRDHGTFTVSDGKYYYTDHSTNHTYINGVQLNKGDGQYIAAGDRMCFGDVMFDVIEQR